MLIAAFRDTGYNIVLFVHILTVIASMAGAVAHPLMIALEQKRPDADLVVLAQRTAPASRIYANVYALAGLIGFGLISMGDWSWGAAWIWLSIVLWVVSLGLMHALLLPAERALADGDVGGVGRVKQVSMAVMLLVLVVVFLMTVKPGSAVL